MVNPVFTPSSTASPTLTVASEQWIQTRNHPGLPHPRRPHYPCYTYMNQLSTVIPRTGKRTKRQGDYTQLGIFRSLAADIAVDFQIFM